MNEIINFEQQSADDSLKKVSPNEKSTMQNTAYKVDKSSLFLIVGFILMVFASLYFFKTGIDKGAIALKENYQSAYSREKESASQTQYQKYYEKAEKEYHVANRTTINIGNLKKIAALEVLKASDVEYITTDEDDNVAAWLEVQGHGTYTVDLREAEAIVDNERSYVTVRVPYPTLSNIDIDDYKKLLFKNNKWFNGSYKKGEQLAIDQLSRAELKIKKEFASNQYFYESAKNAAKSTIQSLVRQFNSEVKDLTVVVEFT